MSASKTFLQINAKRYPSNSTVKPSNRRRNPVMSRVNGSGSDFSCLPRQAKKTSISAMRTTMPSSKNPAKQVTKSRRKRVLPKNATMLNKSILMMCALTLELVLAAREPFVGKGDWIRYQAENGEFVATTVLGVTSRGEVQIVNGHKITQFQIPCGWRDFTSENSLIPGLLARPKPEHIDVSRNDEPADLIDMKDVLREYTAKMDDDGLSPRILHLDKHNMVSYPLGKLKKKGIVLNADIGSKKAYQCFQYAVWRPYNNMVHKKQQRVARRQQQSLEKEELERQRVAAKAEQDRIRHETQRLKEERKNKATQLLTIVKNYFDMTKNGQFQREIPEVFVTDGFAQGHITYHRFSRNIDEALCKKLRICWSDDKKDPKTEYKEIAQLQFYWKGKAKHEWTTLDKIDIAELTKKVDSLILTHKTKYHCRQIDEAKTATESARRSVQGLDLDNILGFELPAFDEKEKTRQISDIEKRITAHMGSFNKMKNEKDRLPNNPADYRLFITKHEGANETHTHAVTMSSLRRQLDGELASIRRIKDKTSRLQSTEIPRLNSVVQQGRGDISSLTDSLQQLQASSKNVPGKKQELANFITATATLIRNTNAKLDQCEKHIQTATAQLTELVTGIERTLSNHNGDRLNAALAENNAAVAALLSGIRTKLRDTNHSFTTNMRVKSRIPVTLGDIEIQEGESGTIISPEGSLPRVRFDNHNDIECEMFPDAIRELNEQEKYMELGRGKDDPELYASAYEKIEKGKAALEEQQNELFRNRISGKKFKSFDISYGKAHIKGTGQYIWDHDVTVFGYQQDSDTGTVNILVKLDPSNDGKVYKVPRKNIKFFTLRK